MHQPHPVRLVVEDDCRRSRLTVFFRPAPGDPALHLVLPLVDRRADRRDPQLVRDALHRHAAAAVPPASSARYVRYQAHLSAYLYLLANPYPGFSASGPTRSTSSCRSEPRCSARWTILLRLLLAIPALPLVLGGGFGLPLGFVVSRGNGGASNNSSGAAASRAAACSPGSARSSAGSPRSRAGGCRRACVTRGRTGSATARSFRAYLLLVTDRYPNATRRRCSSAPSGRRFIPSASSATRTTCAARG